MTIDTRPPLYLDRSDAANWTRFHPEDVGRRIVIVESGIRPCPPEIVQAWDGYGRWEQGHSGNWPRFTSFSDDVLARPPRWMFVDCNRVTLTLSGQEQTYLMNQDGRWERLDSVAEGLRS